MGTPLIFFIDLCRIFLSGSSIGIALTARSAALKREAEAKSRHRKKKIKLIEKQQGNRGGLSLLFYAKEHTLRGMNKFRKPHGNGGRDGGRFSNHGPSRPGFSKSSFSEPARPRFGGSRKEGVELFDAVCSRCGKACQVPFRPNGQKPVYCRACFGIPSSAPSGRESFVRRDAPVVSFEPRPENREMTDLKQQIGVMNSKIDSILRMLGSMPRTVAPVAAVALPALPETDPKIIQKEVPKKKAVKKKSAAKR